jgi:hypothetical protein
VKLVLALACLGILQACSTAHSGASSADAGGAGSGGATDAGNAGLAPCDPLAGKPIELGTIIGVGADLSTLYVDSSNGVFVSNASNELIRQHVVGTGSSGKTEFLFTFVPPGSDLSLARNLLVEVSGAVATAMALGQPNSKAFLNQAPAGTTSLTLMPASATAGMAVVNTPNVIYYLADVANGDILLATVPMNDDGTAPNGGLAIFYGSSTAPIAQRPITSFEQSLSGNGTLTFLCDGETSCTLQFGNVSAPDAGPFGVFALQGLTPQGGATLGVTLRSPTPTTLPAELSFLCFSR